MGGGKHHRDEVGGGSGKVILSGHTNNGKISGGAVRTGAVHGGEKRLRNTLARLAQRVADAATVSAGIGDNSDCLVPSTGIQFKIDAQSGISTYFRVEYGCKQLKRRTEPSPPQ